MSDLAALLDKEASAEIAAIRSEAQNRASELTAAAQAEADAFSASRSAASGVSTMLPWCAPAVPLSLKLLRSSGARTRLSSPCLRLPGPSSKAREEPGG